jgi:hypothetical protein
MQLNRIEALTERKVAITVVRKKRIVALDNFSQSSHIKIACRHLD